MSNRPLRDPSQEIAAANPWYVEDQFAVQLGVPAFRATVENRWRIFAEAIATWAAGQGRPPARMLDAGCGDGINLSFLSRFVQERQWASRIFGADYSPLRIGRASTVGARGLARASVTALGFRDGTFDVIICNQVLEHVPEYRAGLAELRRVLRPGGLLIVGVPNEGSPMGMLRNHVLQRSILRTTDHVNMFTQRTLSTAVREAGLSIVRVEAEGFFVPHTSVHGLLNGIAPVRSGLNAIARALPMCAAGLQAITVRRD